MAISLASLLGIDGHGHGGGNSGQAQQTGLPAAGAMGQGGVLAQLFGLAGGMPAGGVPPMNLGGAPQRAAGDLGAVPAPPSGGLPSSVPMPPIGDASLANAALEAAKAGRPAPVPPMMHQAPGQMAGAPNIMQQKLHPAHMSNR